MTLPKIESNKQVAYTGKQAVSQKNSLEATKPIFSFSSSNEHTGLQIEHDTKLHQEYIQSYVEVKSKDGKTYNVNETLEKRINNVTVELQKAEKENGLIGKVWSWTKNTIGFGDSSNKVREIQANERNLLVQFNANEKARANVFQQLTGCEYNEENLEKFIEGQIKLRSEIAIEKYKEGQEMAVDITSDIASGVIAYGTAAACIAGGIAAAPFTAGASLSGVAIGVSIAAGAGAVTKVAVKGSEAAVSGKKYSLKQAGKDATVGAVSGMIAPVTAGAGGAVASSVAKVAPKFVATTAKLSVEGAMFGFADGGTRSALEGDSISDISLNALKGAGVGALAGNVLGHGGSAIGKTGQYVYEKFTPVYKGNGFTYRKDLLGHKYKLQLDKPDLEPLQFDLPNLKQPNWHPTNLSNELERCHYDKKGVEKLLQENPTIAPIVGSLPQKWGKKLASKEGLEKIDEIFYSFSKKYHNGTLKTEDINTYAESLSKVLKTKVEINYLDEGMIGCVYTINVDGQKLVLKCFKKVNPLSQQGHGNYSELASAVYASKHDPNHFAKFYMGRFGEKEDGYMLTKFVEYSKHNNEFKLSNYLTPMSSGDLGHNVHGNTIIDYGAAWEDALLTRFNTNEKKILRVLVNAIDNNNTDEVNNIISKYSGSKDFINPLKYIKGLVHNRAFSSNAGKPGDSFVLDYFIKRSNCLKMLNIESFPSLNNAQINILPCSSETKGHISNFHAKPWWKIGEQYYGLNYKEWNSLL